MWLVRAKSLTLSTIVPHVAEQFLQPTLHVVISTERLSACARFELRHVLGAPLMEHPGCLQLYERGQ
jgi:hypothetical protein